MHLSTYFNILSFVFSVCLYTYIRIYISSRSDHGETGNPSGTKIVLVTGGAGFVGMHLSAALIKQGHTVIVIDNFNAYYDVKLKIDRAYHIHQMGAQVFSEDLCKTEFLEELFARYKFSHVVHLAAQAGVRYSLENPMAYVKANVECQLALMDVLKDYRHIKLVYASSSSVYGKEAEIPFRLTAHTDRPGNMYAATKKTDELLSLHYCENYNIVSIGLRFFTVYGPWGRPDMSVYKFADAIISGTKLPMFHVSDDTPLGRDFTYVDDVISGVLAAMDNIPASCGERFNLGFGNPVSVPEMIAIMEKNIGIKAKIDKLPMPPTEILRTWADITTSTALLGFKPKTNLTVGVAKFISWYKPYREKREAEAKEANPSDSELWFARLFEDQLLRHARYNQNVTYKDQERTVRRFKHEKHKYYIDKQHLHQSYAKYSGVSPGYDIVHYTEHKENTKILKQLCSELPQCVAFSTDGTLKSHILPLDKWLANTAAVVSTFVADVVNSDWCSSEAHNCDFNAECSNVQKGFYSCQCSRGYVGDGQSCLAKYGTVSEEKLREDYLHLYNNVFNITEMKMNKDMVFFQGVESVGGDYISASQYAGNIDKLLEICREEPICIAFTTDGHLKMQLSSPTEWQKYSSDTSGGMYVYDINYCMFYGSRCPEYSECKHIGRGKSECVCKEGFFMFYNECHKVPIARTLVPSIAKCTGNLC